MEAAGQVGGDGGTPGRRQSGGDVTLGVRARQSCCSCNSTLPHLRQRCFARLHAALLLTCLSSTATCAPHPAVSLRCNIHAKVQNHSAAWCLVATPAKPCKACKGCTVGIHSAASGPCSWLMPDTLTAGGVHTTGQRADAAKRRGATHPGAAAALSDRRVGAAAARR
jgi:hypothetical protein